MKVFGIIVIMSMVWIAIFVCILENVHLGIEKSYGRGWCTGVDKAVEKVFGENVHSVFYFTYKVFQCPIKKWCLVEQNSGALSSKEVEIK